MDGRGSIYIAGQLTGEANFSGEIVETTDASQDAFVAAYEPDGRLAWVQLLGAAGIERSADIGYDPEASLVYVLIDTEGGDLSAEVTGATSGNMLIALSTDGELEWHRQVIESDIPFSPRLAAGRGVTVAAWLLGMASVAGETRSSAGALDTVLIEYDSSGSLLRSPRSFSGGGELGEIMITDIDRTPRGQTVFTGVSRGTGTDLGRGLRANSSPDSFNLFVASTHGDGTTAWDYWDDSTAYPITTAIASDGERVVVVGTFSGILSAAGSTLDFPTSGYSAFILSLSSSDGSALQLRGWPWNGSSVPAVAPSVDVSSRGDVIVGGAFSASVDFGGGARPGPMPGPPDPFNRAAFYAIFDSDLRHRADHVLTYAAWPDAPCAEATCRSQVNDLVVGPADSLAIVGEFFGTIDLGSGSRLSAGSNDGFVIRASN